MTQHTIFGAGPSGLYAAWRLVTGTTIDGDPLVAQGDTIELIEWGAYAFEDDDGGTRLPAGRICTHHYEGDVSHSYIEVGGMRYLQWDSDKRAGHQLVTKTISELGLDDDVVDFYTTDNPLYYLRGKAYYQQDLSAQNPAPYGTPGNNERPSDELVDHISDLLTGTPAPTTRADECAFYADGTLPPTTNSVVYNPGDTVSNIGYWNFFYDQAGSEGYNYANDGAGYNANAINWNAADAAIYNGEFAPGLTFKTLKYGYSSMFIELFQQAKREAGRKGVTFSLTQRTRLHSIWLDGDTVSYRTASANDPEHTNSQVLTTDSAFLAMPRHAIELVAQATRYADTTGDFLNAAPVRNYVESIIEQPSFKIAMFFDRDWWNDDDVPFKPKLTNKNASDSTSVYGPTITDLPLRQVYYFGNNATDNDGPPVYGLLASYDDMRFTRFWRELELGVNERRTTAESCDLQPMDGSGVASSEMVQMLRLELAKVHYGDPNKAWDIPAPLETVFMDWGLNPFGAGYHAWAAHYDIVDVMQKIRKPTVLGETGDAPVYIVGSAYSNDQAWVEGAFNTVESVLTEYYDAATIADPGDAYPFVCGTG